MFFVFTVDFFGLEHDCTLELDKEVNEDLVFFVGDVEGFACHPEHPGHGIGDE